jgi:hypothetical protein
VDYRPWLAHDTFNRRDELLKALASSQAVVAQGEWRVTSGQLMPTPSESPALLLVDVGRQDVDVSIDVFLEQTRRPAQAGLIVRSDRASCQHRFTVQADGPAVIVQVESQLGGQWSVLMREVRAVHKRGFTLRAVADGDSLVCELDGAAVFQGACAAFAAATFVGLLNTGEASRFDNLEVRAAR